MTVDIAAIRAAAKSKGALETIILPPLDVLTLCDLAERALEHDGRLSTHWETCWKAHDRCAAALYRKEHEA